MPKFYFDVLQVEQVFSNIITNSLEVLSKNDEIIITLENEKNENIIIRFIDTGPGIKEEILDMAFDPYFTTKKNGTGLGLSICYRILMAHGAKIEIGNNKDKGIIIITQSNIYRTIERQHNANQKKKASDQDTVLLMSLSI